MRDIDYLMNEAKVAEDNFSAKETALFHYFNPNGVCKIAFDLLCSLTGGDWLCMNIDFQMHGEYIAKQAMNKRVNRSWELYYHIDELKRVIDERSSK